MALTPEQAQRILETMESVDKITFKNLKNELSDMGDALDKVVSDVLGKQKEYATELEKAAAALEFAKKKKEEEIEIQKKLAESLEFKKKLEAELVNLDDEKKKKQQERIDKLQEEVNGLKNISGLTEDEIKKIDEIIERNKELLELTEERLEAQSDVLGLQESARQETKNILEATLGLKDVTKDYADILIDSIAKDGFKKGFKTFNEAMKGAASAYKEMFTAANLMKSGKNVLKDIAKNAKKDIFSLDGLLMKFQQLDENFVQNTGLSKQLGEQMKVLQGEARKNGFVLDELNNIYTSLAQTSKTFALLAKKEREEMTRMGLSMTRLGVTTAAFAEIYDNLNRTFSTTGPLTKVMITDLTNFGVALGTGPNKMLEQFNQNFDVFVRYGRDKGVKIFKELAVTAKMAGVEMSELVGIAKQFDTFDGAAESAANLNYILGGPLLNSMDLLNATEAERVQMLKSAMDASGRSFAEMGRFQKDLVAQTLGTNVAAAERLFNEKNIEQIKNTTAAIQDQTNSLGSLEQRANDATTEQQRRDAAKEASLNNLTKLVGGLVEKMQSLITKFTDLASGVGPIILAISSIAQVITAVVTAVTALNVGLGALKLILATGLIGAVVALGAGLYNMSQGRSFLPKFESGTDNSPGMFIAGDSSDGTAKPELVVSPPGSSVINNKNLETFSKAISNTNTSNKAISNTNTSNKAISNTNTSNNYNNTPAESKVASGEKTINITLKLDGEVLGKHTRKLANEVMIENLEFNLGV